MIDDSSLDREPVEILAEEFVERLRRGEHPSLREYKDKYPELAEEIDDIFPALAMMEEIDPDVGEMTQPNPDQEVELPRLSQLGDFRIIREAGRGGMGVVYEAEQVSLSRHVALKVLPATALPDSKHVRRFEREAKSAARLHHTNIVPVFGVGEQDGMHYYVMQFIQGLPLDEVIVELKRIQAQPTGQMTTPVSRGEENAPPREYSAANVARSLMTGQFPRTDIGVDDLHPNLAETQPGELQGRRPHAELDTSKVMRTETLDLSGSLSGSSSGSLSLPGSSGVHDKGPQRHKPFTYWESVANIGHQVAEALQYAHEQGILHRDIKPSNLLLDMKGSVWITDFGLAKATDQQDITHTGDILGTLRYMPPEAFEGKTDARSDLYSLGLTLYELLSFQPAYGDKDRHQLIRQVTGIPAPALDKLNPAIPRDLVTVVHKAIDRDPSHRYQSAQELAEDLSRFLHDQPILARRVSLSERLVRWSRRNKALAASLAMVCLLLLIFNIAGPMVTLHLRQLNQDLLRNETDLKQKQAELERAGEESRLRANEMEKLAVARRQEAQKAIAARDQARRSEYTSTLLAAQQAITSPGSYQRGKELLDGLRPPAGENELRGIEFHLLNSLPDTSGDQIINRGLAGHLANISFSPDGRFLAGAELESNAVVVVDLESGDILKRFSGHQSKVRQVEWKSNGTQLVSCDNQQSIRVWDVERKVELNSFQAGKVFALSPDESRILTGKRDGRVQILATDTGELLEVFEGHVAQVHDVAWSIDGRIASCSGDGTVRLWDPGTQKSVLLTESDPDRRPVRWTCLKFSPDGSKLAASTSQAGSESIVIWDMENLDRIKRSPVTMGIFAISWSHDGTRLAGVKGNTVEIWEPATWKRVRRYTNHQLTRSVAWSPDDRRLALRGANGVVYLCNVAQEETQPDFVVQRNGVSQLAWSPDGQCFATDGIDGKVRIWDVRSKQELAVFDGHQGFLIESLDWHPRQDRLVSCDRSGVALVWSWDGKHPRQERCLDPYSDNFQIRKICWSPDGSQIAVAETQKGFRSNNSFIRIIDAESFKPLDKLDTVGLASISWELNSQGNSRMAIAGQNQLKVWDPVERTIDELLPKSLKSAMIVSLNPQVDRVAVAGESNLEAFGDDVNTASLWIIDLQTKQELRLRGHDSILTSIDWSKDGTRLLTSGLDGLCILWDAASGQQLVSFKAPDRLGVFTARFSPDELQIAFAGDFRGVRLLDATPSYEQQLSPKLLPGLDDRLRSAPTLKDLVLRGRIKANQGNWDEAARDFDRAAELTASGQPPALWFETAWWLAGPYPESLAESQPPERHLDPQQPIPASSVLGDPTTWDAIGISEKLDLGAYLAGAEHASAYAMKRIYAAERQTIGLLLGADDQVRVWCNGTLQHVREETRAAVSDDEAVELTLEAGWNDLLIKVANRTGAHGLIARLSRNPVELAEVFNRNQQWEQALTWWERAAVIQSDDPALSVAHGRAALRSGRRELAAEIFDKALRAGNDFPVLQKIAEAYLEDALAQSEGAAESLDRSQQHYEQLRKSEGNSDNGVEGLANVLLARSALEMESTWTLLEPVAMESSGGATLTRLEDGSILASGINPDFDSYELVMETNLTTITGVKLEVMTHESLPSRGPGRATSPNGAAGGFAMTHWNWEEETSRTAIRFDQVASDFSVTNPRLPITVNHWNISGGVGKSHEAVFHMATPIRRDSGLRFRIRMQFNPGPNWTGQNLGRFRIFVTDNATTFSKKKRYLVAKRVPAPLLKLAKAYDLNGEPDLAAQANETVLEDLNRRIRTGAASPDIFQTRGELHARLGRIEEAIADFDSAAKDSREGVVDLVLRLGQDTPELADARIDLLNAALIHDSDHLGGLREKARLDYGLQRLDEAAQALRRVVELAPQDPRVPQRVFAGSCHELGALLIKTGDLEGFRQFRKSLIGRFQTFDQSGPAATVTEMCLLLPLEDLDAEQRDALEKLGEFADYPGVGQAEQWDQVRTAMLKYRLGNFTESYRLSEQSVSTSDAVTAIALAYCFGAMAQQELGHETKAQELLQKANRVITDEFPLLGEGVSNSWNNQLIAELAYDEAKRLIDPNN